MYSEHIYSALVLDQTASGKKRIRSYPDLIALDCRAYTVYFYLKDKRRVKIDDPATVMPAPPYQFDPRKPQVLPEEYVGGTLIKPGQLDGRTESYRFSVQNIQELNG